MQTRATKQLALLFATASAAAITACNSHPATQQAAPKPPLPPADTTAIRHLFTVWQQQQLRDSIFWPADSCNPRVVARRQPAELVLGLPDASDYHYSYADLNTDGTLDGLVTFAPNQCDGGNGSMWTQVAVLLLSGTSGYCVTDTLNVKHFANAATDGTGFYHLDSIAVNRLFGTYYEFGEGSGHCCPSVQQPVAFDFRRRLRLQ